MKKGLFADGSEDALTVWNHYKVGFYMHHGRGFNYWTILSLDEDVKSRARKIVTPQFSHTLEMGMFESTTINLHLSNLGVMV